MSAAKVEMIPWDHTSEEHAQRMYIQRLACGWRSDEIQKWKDLTSQGKKTLYWIVLSDALPNMDEMLAKHLAKYTDESTPIHDTATTHWLEPRTPTQRAFIPIGHVALDIREEENAHVGVTEDHVVWIAGLYLSWEIQRGGIGRAAMMGAEKIAAEPPLNAEYIVLDTMRKEQQLQKDFLDVMYVQQGNPPPTVSTEDWYRRQGYVAFHISTASYMWVHPTKGTKMPIDQIFFKKKLV